MSFLGVLSGGNDNIHFMTTRIPNRAHQIFSQCDLLEIENSSERNSAVGVCGKNRTCLTRCLRCSVHIGDTANIATSIFLDANRVLVGKIEIGQQVCTRHPALK